MTIFAPLMILASSVVTFQGFVPPHEASDGVRRQVSADGAADLSAAFRSCGVADYEREPGANGNAYEFATTRDDKAAVPCLSARLPEGARITPLDHWIADAPAR